MEESRILEIKKIIMILKYQVLIFGGIVVEQLVDIVCYLFEKGFPVPAIMETKSGTPILEIHEEGNPPVST